MESNVEYLGSCLCGDIQFAVQPPTLFCAHCHCHYCRRAHGAAVVTWIGVPEDRFTVRAGSHRLTWYHSSVQSQRGFCSRCGTTLLFKSSLAPGEMHIARALVEGPIDRTPSAHVFADQHVSWQPISDELPRYTSDSTILSKYQAVSPTDEPE